MAINNNSPTFTYVGWSGASVLYNDELYSVSKAYTKDKYIYWDVNNPYIFKTSMIPLERSSSLFLVVINDRGMYTLVPNEGIVVSFDDSNNAAIQERIYGIYEKNKEYDEKFVAVEIDIDGIKSIVGESEDDEGTLVNRMSKIEQRADGIELSVSEVTKEFNDSVEMGRLREEVNSSFLKLNTDLGMFKSITTKHFKDDRISNDEKIEIDTSVEVLTGSKSALFLCLDEVVEIAQTSGMTNDITLINNGKTALDQAHTNLVNTINTIISDNVITPSDRTLVINVFAQYNLKINELKNICDNVVLLGAGGKIIEELAKIGIKSDEIELRVQETVKNSTKNLLPNSNFASRQGKLHEWLTWFSSEESSIFYNQHGGFPNGEGIGIQSRNTNAIGEIQTKTIRVAKGDVFTLSADVLVERNLKPCSIIFREVYPGGWQNTQSYELPTNTSGRVNVSHVVQREDAKELQIIFINKGASSTTSSFVVFFINRVQLEKGLEATNWDLSSSDMLESKFSEIKITTDAIQSTVSSQDTRLGKAESTIIQQANQIATKVDVNGVKSTIEQNPESVRIAFSGINDSIDFDHQGIKVWHPNGKHTRISSDGISMVNNNTGGVLGDYHYLTYVVGFTTTADTASVKWVQLPDEFKGKNFSGYATLSDTWEGSWNYGEPWVIQRMVAFVRDYDRPNGRISVQGYRTDKNYSTGEHRHGSIAGMLIVIA